MPQPNPISLPVLYRVYGITLSSNVILDVPVPVGEGPVELALEVTNAPPVGRSLDSLEPVYTDGRRKDGRPAFAFYRTGNAAAIRVTGAIDFYIEPTDIVAHVTSPRHSYVLEIALFGLVMSLWLEMRGRLTLHASTVVVDGSAVAFAGERGSGKSSTAATMVAAGFPLLADDLLAVDVGHEQVIAFPGYPQIRMWPEQAHHFTGRLDHPAFHPGHDKRRVIIGNGFGSFVSESKPLTRIYLVRRALTGDAPVTFRRLEPRHGMLALLQHSFLVPELARYDLQPQRLSGLATLLETTHVAEITVPNGLDRLPRVAAAVREDAAGPS